MGVATLLDHGTDGDGEVPVDFRSLGQIGQTGEGVVGVRVADPDLTGTEWVPAKDRSKKGGLAGTIGPDHRGQRIAEKLGVNRLERGTPSKVDGYVMEPKDVGVHGVSLFGV